MSNNGNVSTEALEDVAAALERYISEMNNHVQKMKDASRDCSDNMGSDKYSAMAIEDLDNCVRQLEESMEDAEGIRRAIIETIEEIEREI